MIKPIKGQGAQRNVSQRFSSYVHEINQYTDEVEEIQGKTEFIDVYPKTIVNKVISPDIGSAYSMNPYQGCEHGCSYCFARPTHEFWNYNAGVDFERTILVKKNAPKLLEQFFQKRNYIPEPIMLSGNTDCYQPCERNFKLTRQLLETCLRYKHPVSIITKNALVLRDLDLLVKLNKLNLIRVRFSITTLDEDLRRRMEPRTSSSLKRLETLKTLSTAGIPTYVLMAPIIPGLNSHEILNMMKITSENGAQGFGLTMVRLNGAVYPVFKEWIEAHYPMKSEKVLNQIKELHGGSHEDMRFGTRMRGEGRLAESFQAMLQLGQKKYFTQRELKKLDTHHFSPKPHQLKLF